jgi:hypothetical protein
MLCYVQCVIVAVVCAVTVSAVAHDSASDAVYSTQEQLSSS